jgi:hypothetical protein
MAIGVSSFAQHNKLTPIKNPPALTNGKAMADEFYNPPASVTKNTAPAHINTLHPRFSSAANVYGFIFQNLQSSLTYNSDLNMLALFHRRPVDWTGLTPGGMGLSGYSTVKWSTDLGLTWDSTCIYQNDVEWARYPTGTIYNPASNSNIANAKFVMSGPTTNAMSVWSGDYFTSAPIQSGAQYTNDQQWYSTTAPGVSYQAGFARSSAAQAGNTIYVCGLKTSSTSAYQTGYGIALFKGTYNGSTSSFDWTQDSIVGQWTYNNNGSLFNQYNFMEAKIAFDPAGNTGYIVVNGADSLSTAPSAKKYLQPMVWKTSDAGLTWTRVNQNYDWLANHPEIGYNIRPTITSEILPSFMETYGGDVTVDANGVLHYATALMPGYSSHPDSLFYTYTYPFSHEQYNGTARPWVFDFMTNGNGAWDARYIGDLYTGNVGDQSWDTTSSLNMWVNNAGGTATYSKRIQVSRSANGNIIFYSWTDSDTNQVVTGSGLTQYMPNTLPGLSYLGYDINSNLYTDVSWLDPGTNAYTAFWYYSASSTLTEPTAGEFHLPAVYIDSRNESYDITQPVDIYFTNDAQSVTGDFNRMGLPNNTAPYNITSFVFGLKEAAGSDGFVSQNYPNPCSNHTFIKVKLEQPDNVSLVVTSLLGQEVMRKEIKAQAGENQLDLDASTLSPGVYYYTVSANGRSTTHKMTIAR